MQLLYLRVHKLDYTVEMRYSPYGFGGRIFNLD
jgi:hypothetical protein